MTRRGVRFTGDTDGPHLRDTNIRAEVRMLRDAGIPSDAQVEQTVRWAREASFVEAEPSERGR